MASDIIELTARGQSRFLVHKDILASQSQPFRNAVSGVWKESTERKINLDDWDKDTVGRLVEFLYTGNYSYPDPDPASVVSDRTPAAVRARSLRDRSPDESSRSRPLTPLEQCLPRCFTENRKTDAERLSGFAPEHHEYREPLLAHAAVYALACYKDIHPLQCLALRRLVMTLSAISPVRGNARLPPGIIDVVRYVYAHTDALRSSEEPLRRVVAQFAALNFPALQTKPEFAELLTEGGDFVTDLMAKVSRRLVAAEKGLGVSVGGAAAPRRFVARIRVSAFLLLLLWIGAACLWARRDADSVQHPASRLYPGAERRQQRHQPPPAQLPPAPRRAVLVSYDLGVPGARVHRSRERSVHRVSDQHPVRARREQVRSWEKRGHRHVPLFGPGKGSECLREDHRGGAMGRRGQS